MQENKIGITIITGFLGAGKTSLINRIIEKESSYKFAIIENEFAELNIDSEIIKGIDKSSIVELSNGCICCTKNGELQETLNELLSSNFYFDHLIIETTGIAKPDSIVQSIVANEYLKQVFYIDSVVCVVDALNFDDNLLQPEAVEQILMSDTVIINKTDKATLADKKDNVLIINTLCRIIPAVYSDYNEHNIIESNKFIEADFLKSFDISSKHQHADNNHFNSIAVNLELVFDRDKFMEWIEYFLHINQNSIYRIKGILNFNNDFRKYIFQSVKTAFSVEEGDFWTQGESKNNRLIFIGNNLDKQSIINELNLLT